MTEDTAAHRRWHLRERLVAERHKHLLFGNMLSAAVQLLFWTSLTCSGVAAVLGVLPSPTVEKWHIGVLSATAVGLLVAIREGRLQPRANWHYQRTADLSDLIDRLDFEIPTDPSAADIAAVAQEYRKMRRKWQSTAVSLQDGPQHRRAKDQLA